METNRDELERQQALDILKAQYEMHSKTIKESERRMQDQLKEDGSKMFTKSQIESRLLPLKDALDDTLQQYVQIGGNPDDLTKKTKSKPTRVYNETKTTKVKKVEEEKTEEKIIKYLRSLILRSLTVIVLFL